MFGEPSLNALPLSTPGGVRTHTLAILSRLPLPIGLPGLMRPVVRLRLRSGCELLERRARLHAGLDGDVVATQ